MAGGVESMSFVPMSGNKPSLNPWLVEKVSGIVPVDGADGGASGEALRDHARPRRMQFAYESHQKALAAIVAGRFDAEIVAIPVTNTTVDVNGKAGATKVKDGERVPQRTKARGRTRRSTCWRS